MVRPVAVGVSGGRWVTRHVIGLPALQLSPDGGGKGPGRQRGGPDRRDSADLVREKEFEFAADAAQTEV
jgi:hypothetical protein